MELHYRPKFFTSLKDVRLGGKKGPYCYFLYLAENSRDAGGQLLGLSLVRGRAETIYFYVCNSQP